MVIGSRVICSSDFLLCFQTLDIVAENPDKFRVVALAAGSNVTLLADQVCTKLLKLSCHR